MTRRRPNRSFLSYIDLSREYYAAHGYSRPYKWIYHQNKIPTVVVGSARDVVEECGVARFLFTGFPLRIPRSLTAFVIPDVKNTCMSYSVSVTAFNF